MNTRNTKRRMSGMNTYKEHLQYNEKERNVKNVVFDPRQLFDRCQNFVDSRHPCHPRQNFDGRESFMDPRHPRHPPQNFDPQNLFAPRQNLMKPHHTTASTHPCHLRHPRYLTESIVFWFL